MSNLEAVKATRKFGLEPFIDGDQNLTFDLLSFWRWSGSDILSNATRGVLAEYLVARALGTGVDDVRDEWAACDLTLPNGLKIEVKSSAYLQSWFQKRLSAISFIVARTREWDTKTSELSAVPARRANVYVFALLAHQDKATVNPMNVDQWQFYVLPTSVLEARSRSRYSITLKTLETLCPPIAYQNLRQAVEEAARTKRPSD